MFNNYGEILSKLFKDQDTASGIGNLFSGFQEQNAMGNGGAMDLNSYSTNAFQGYNFKNGGVVEMYNKGGVTEGEIESRQESPAEKVLSELGMDVGAYRKYRDLVINHETGGTFDPKQKQVGGGPGRGLFQFEADSAKTAAKRLKTYFANKNLPSPEFLEGVSDATELSPDEQELLFAGQMMDKIKDSEKGGFKVRLNKTFNRDSWEEDDFADAWINNHNKTQGVERADRINKFKSDSKVIFDKAGSLTTRETQITPFVDENALMAQDFDFMQYADNPDKAFLGKLIKEIGKGAKRFIKQPLKTIGKGLGELGKGVADTSLSLIGAGDVINNSYLDRDKTLGNIANVTGTVARTGLDFLVPGAGAALGAVGGALNGAAQNNQANKQQREAQEGFNNSAAGGMQELMGLLGGGFSGMGMGQQQNPMAMLSSLFGVGQFENGGIINAIPEGLEGVQAEKYRGKIEKLILPDGMIADSNAKKSHERMDDDEVTDVLPGGSYIASSRPNMKLSRDKMENIIFGYKSLPYEEHAKGKVPELVTAADIIPTKKKKVLPSEYAELIKKTFPVYDHDDMFTRAANTENMASRAPYLQVLVELGENKRQTIESASGQFKYGGYVKPRKALNGLALGAIGQGANLLGGILNLGSQRKELKNQEQSFYDLNKRLQAINNTSMGVGIAGQLAQDTTMQDYKSDFSRLENFNTGTPQSFIDAQAAPNVDVASMIDRLGDRGGIAALANLNKQTTDSRNNAAINARNRQQQLDFDIANRITQGENQDRDRNTNLRHQETSARNNVFNNIAGQIQGGLQNDASLQSNAYNITSELGMQRAGLTGQGLAMAGNAMGNIAGMAMADPNYSANSSLFGGSSQIPQAQGPAQTMDRNQILNLFPQNSFTPPAHPGLNTVPTIPNYNSPYFNPFFGQ